MRLILLLAAAATAFAQPDTGTITITTSRNVTAIPDKVVYDVILRTDASSGLSEAVARLASAGITAANLSSVSGAGSSMYWSFRLVTAFSKMAETYAALSKLQEPPALRELSPALMFQVTGQQTSPEAAAQACPFSALVSDARKEADRIATPAGVHVGQIVGLSESPAVPEYLASLSVVLTGSFSAIRRGGIPTELFLPPSVYGPIPAYTPPCSLVVQFRLVP
jgi:hypothetical protein